MAPANEFDAIVIGGGFFGCNVALYLAERGDRVLIVEKDADLLQRASYGNQARVHNGYHYPRHFMTAVKSHVNFPRFLVDFRDCIDTSFASYYAVARRFSKTSARQFQNVMEHIGAPIEVAPKEVANLFNADLIEAVFRVEECAFDAVKLKMRMRDRIEAAGVSLKLNCTANRVEPASKRRIGVQTVASNESTTIFADRVFNCAYSNTNDLLYRSGIGLIPLKHEVAELCLVAVPEELRGLAVTVMCGPFFSLVPYPPRGLHTLSHVRYTPHYFWNDDGGAFTSPYERMRAATLVTHFPAMIRDAARYLPCLERATHEDSIWEVKTTLPVNERDDGRPILFKSAHGLPGLTCVMGGKIDNIYDIRQEVEDLCTK